MKTQFFPTFVLLLVLISCKQGPDPQAMLASNVIFLGEEICCSNLMTKDNELVYSDLADHSYDYLLAINIDIYVQALDLQPGDSMKINYVLTEKPHECKVICNRPDGVKIELMSAKKL